MGSTRVSTIGPWRLVRTIGHGATSKVKLAVHRETGERRAVKLVSRRKFREQWERSRQKKGAAAETVEAKERRVLREASLLYTLRHPNILPLLDFHITPSHYIMFFEYVEGVRMLDFVQCHRQLSEKIARKFFKQLLCAVDYLHQAGIVHRDLKIENVMVVEGTGQIKLIDFGLSNFYDGHHLLTTYCGSLYFAAPELLHGRPYLGPEVDVWSLGVILYVMATGQVPFDDPNVPKLHEKIKCGQVDYPAGMPRLLRSLLERMLTVDPKRRATVTEVMNHAWLMEPHSNRRMNPGYAPSLGKIGPVLDDLIVDTLLDLFGYEMDRRQVYSTLRAAGQDWPAYEQNPIVRLYLLLRHRMTSTNHLPTRHSWSDLASTQSTVNSPVLKRSSSVLPPTTSNNAGGEEQTQLLSTSPLSQREMYPLHAPSLKSFLTATATVFKSTVGLRRELIRAMEAMGLRFEDHLTSFTVETIASPALPAQWCRFEVDVVHGMGVHWLQFRRLSGDVGVYKALIAHLQNEIKN